MNDLTATPSLPNAGSSSPADVFIRILKQAEVSSGKIPTTINVPNAMQLVFVILQGISLLILLVQDTVNLAPFNNLGAQVRYLGWTKLVIGTLFMAGGVVLCLYLTIRFAGVPLSLSAKIFFVFWWGMLMFGMFMSWYKPWFFGPTQKELDLYQALFAGTHSVLPVRHGFPGPNTLHLVLHALGVPCAVLGFLKVASVF